MNHYKIDTISAIIKDDTKDVALNLTDSSVKDKRKGTWQVQETHRKRDVDFQQKNKEKLPGNSSEEVGEYHPCSLQRYWGRENSAQEKGDFV